MTTSVVETKAPAKRQAVNWNRKEDDFTLMFWEQNFAQIWSEEEIAVSSDKNDWNSMTPAERDTYQKVLGGLTLLDTEQGGEGMPLLEVHTPGLQRKSVLALMGFMEHVHAKSYSHIFTTLSSNEEIDRVFAWVKDNPQLQTKAALIGRYYDALQKPEVTPKELYMAYVASVFLESYLFYSGFFYPLYLAGQGRMTASGEIISLIIRDEAVHSVYSGLLAQDVYSRLSPREQQEADREMIDLLEELYRNEVAYSDALYGELGLAEDVKVYVRYNANRALMNLGKEVYFAEETIHPVVENGIKTTSKNHDFFSVKGNSYQKSTAVVALRDEDFVFA